VKRRAKHSRAGHRPQAANGRLPLWQNWSSLAVTVIAACGARDAPTTSSELVRSSPLKVNITQPDARSAKSTPTADGEVSSYPIEVADCEAPVPKPDTTRFAVIGDYGQAGPGESKVAKLVKGWDPEFVLTLGDNNYPYGEADTIDNNVGYYFREFICPYVGKHGAGATTNRFFPSLGNHDWYTTGAKPYLDYFKSLPGNGRYYDVHWGNVHFFMLDTDPNEPDGVDAKSVQAQWLAGAAKKSKAPWQLVAGHHPPYSSASHGNEAYMQWPFKAAGVDLALFGHDHAYERIVVDGLTYIVNGLGGRSLYPFENVLPESQVRFNATLGAQLIEATSEQLTSRFYDIDGKLIDEFTLNH
jgi:tartrate-resistant acid phosphatase type 5